METQILAALIGGAAGSITALLISLLDRRRRLAETEKLLAEVEHLREQTKVLRNRAREIERAKYQKLITDFLRPFQDLLAYNERIYDDLLEERGALEYRPIALRKYFGSLPDTDKRKFVWEERIERLRNNNLSILALIQKYSAQIVTPEFGKACVEFRFHADEWEDVWKVVEPLHFRPEAEEEVTNGEPIPANEIVGDDELREETLYAKRFPADLPSTLKDELREVERRAE